jgi:hypothetical protein
MEKVFMSRKEAATALCVTDQSVDDYRMAGKLRATKNGRKVLILTEDVRKMQKALMEVVK